MVQKTVWALSKIQRPLRHVSAVYYKLQKQPREMFSKKILFLENFAKFTGKHLCQSLFFKKVEGLFRNLLTTASKFSIKFKN